jgi:hypothetical protein
MLVSANNPNTHSITDLDSIHNYYEGLVLDQIQRSIPERLDNGDYIADIACVALNHLPPRYIRYSVDMAFYLSPEERQEMLDKVKLAVNDAINVVENSQTHTQAE